VSDFPATATRPGPLVATGSFCFHWRNFLFPLAFPLVLLPGPRLFASSSTAALLGFCVAALGQLVRGATIGFEYVIRGGRKRRIYAKDLVTNGLYGHSRNPMYVGNLLILLGVAAGSNSRNCVAVAVPLFTLVYSAIVAAEERYLRAKFGAAFDAYCREVPRWLPRLGGLRESTGGMSFRWRRVIVKEYGTPFGWLSGISLLGIWNLWAEDRTWVGDGPYVSMFILIAAAAMLLWGTALCLKKSRRLVAD
jgi:protein-S-isoprenylcysteine O-methyltransferase Ste14